MSSAAPQDVPQPKVVVVDEQSPSCEFCRWPLRDEKLPVAVVFCVTVAASAGIGLWGGTMWWGVVALVALLISLWRMWIPVTFHLSELGVVQSALRRRWRRPWEDYFAYEIQNDGVLLLPEDDISVLGRLKGLYIPFADQREEILNVLSEYLTEVER